MGCDIHTTAEQNVGGRWVGIGFEPFDWRSYGMFGFLANVRNYSDVPYIAADRGLPEDASELVRERYPEDGHSHSWVLVDELLAFDYDQPVEDRRVTVQLSERVWSGAGTAEPGDGRATTYREFLGEAFFDDLAKLKELGVERVVFWFDS